MFPFLYLDRVQSFFFYDFRWSPLLWLCQDLIVSIICLVCHLLFLNWLHLAHSYHLKQSKAKQNETLTVCGTRLRPSLDPNCPELASGRPGVYHGASLGWDGWRGERRRFGQREREVELPWRPCLPQPPQGLPCSGPVNSGGHPSVLGRGAWPWAAAPAADPGQSTAVVAKIEMKFSLPREQGKQREQRTGWRRNITWPERVHQA